MATGSEHYASAEAVLAELQAAPETSEQGHATAAMHRLVLALVHATLALTAATALPADREGFYEAGYGEDRRHLVDPDPDDAV
jgi:hypothetical protein